MKILNICFVVIIFTMLHQTKLVKGYRILGLFPLHGKSHFIVAERIMKELARKGHQVDVVGHFPLKKPLPNYKDLSLKGSLPEVVNNVTYNDMQSVTTFSVKTFTKLAGDPVCDLLGHSVIQNIIKNPANPPYDAIVVEMFASNCYLVFGQILKAPLIGLVTSTWFDWLNMPMANSYNAAITPHAFSKARHPMTFWERLENVLVTTLINFEFHRCMETQMSYVHKYIGKQFHNIYDLHQDIVLLLINSHYSINGLQSFPPGIVEVGGLHIVDDNTSLPAVVQNWLDNAKQGCVYISFGSMVKIESFPKRVLDVFYDTIKMMAPIKFLLKIAKKNELPPGLPENAITYHWLPQIKVLKHKNTKAFVTHGGLMGTLESIFAGVPMVGFPLFGDQHSNLENYVNQKIALVLDHDTLNTESFAGALNTVINDLEYRMSIKKLSALYFDRPTPPLETAMYWIEYVIKHGNVLQSNGMHMPWWKFALIDIYLFIILCTIAIVYILYVIIKQIFRLCISTRKNKIQSSKKNS